MIVSKTHWFQYRGERGWWSHVLRSSVNCSSSKHLSVVIPTLNWNVRGRNLYLSHLPTYCDKELNNYQRHYYFPHWRLIASVAARITLLCISYRDCRQGVQLVQWLHQRQGAADGLQHTDGDPVPAPVQSPAPLQLPLWEVWRFRLA